MRALSLSFAWLLVMTCFSAPLSQTSDLQETGVRVIGEVRNKLFPYRPPRELDILLKVEDATFKAEYVVEDLRPSEEDKAVASYKCRLPRECRGHTVTIEVNDSDYVLINEEEFQPIDPDYYERNVLVVHRSNLAQQLYKEADELYAAGLFDSSLSLLERSIRTRARGPSLILWTHVAGSLFRVDSLFAPEFDSIPMNGAAAIFFRSLPPVFQYNRWKEIGLAASRDLPLLENFSATDSLRYALAQQCLEAAIMIDSTFAQPYQALYQAEFAVGDYRSAIRTVDRYLEIVPSALSTNTGAVFLTERATFLEILTDYRTSTLTTYARKLKADIQLRELWNRQLTFIKSYLGQSSDTTSAIYQRLTRVSDEVGSMIE